MHECPTCEHLCTPSWQVSLVRTITLSLCFSWASSPFIIFVGTDHQNCPNNSSRDPKHMILLVQRKRYLGKCCFLFSFSCLQRRYIKANKQGFFVLVWLDKSQPESKLFLTFFLKLSLFAFMTTFIWYYKHVHKYRWLLLHFISPGNLSKWLRFQGLSFLAPHLGWNI